MRRSRSIRLVNSFQLFCSNIAQRNISDDASDIGNESEPKIIINDTIKSFLKLESAFW